MRINTRLNRIELTKRERQTLMDAMKLLTLIGKHGSDTNGDFAEVAADQIDKTLQSLSPEEAVV